MQDSDSLYPIKTVGFIPTVFLCLLSFILDGYCSLAVTPMILDKSVCVRPYPSNGRSTPVPGAVTASRHQALQAPLRPVTPLLSAVPVADHPLYWLLRCWRGFPVLSVSVAPV